MEDDAVHIALYSPQWPANEFPNGIVTYVHHLRAELINQGHRVSVITSRIGGSNEDAGIHLVEPPATFKILRKLNGIFGRGSYHVLNWGKAIGAKVQDLNRTDPIDVMEMEESYGWCADVQRLASIPVVVKLHGPAFLDLVANDGQTETAVMKIAMEGRGLQQIAAIISPSQSTLSSTLARYRLRPQLKRVVPNLIEKGSGLKHWNLEKCDRKTILFVGRFDWRKGGDMMLLAFRRLLETDDSLKLVFVGPDRGLTMPDRPKIFFDEYRNSLFAEAQQRHIHYLGQLPRSALADLRTKAMMTIVPSRWESQCYTVMEALIQGCPVVASNVGGMAEVIEHGVTGLLAHVNDVEDLCEKMSSILNDPRLARQLGENACHSVADRYSTRRLVRETVEMYGEVISMAKTRVG
jgi:glycosyltransferase involved in cell wall biosynthesis